MLIHPYPELAVTLLAVFSRRCLVFFQEAKYLHMSRVCPLFRSGFHELQTQELEVFWLGLPRRTGRRGGNYLKRAEDAEQLSPFKGMPRYWYLLNPIEPT